MDQLIASQFVTDLKSQRTRSYESGFLRETLVRTLIQSVNYGYIVLTPSQQDHTADEFIHQIQLKRQEGTRLTFRVVQSVLANIVAQRLEEHVIQLILGNLDSDQLIEPDSNNVSDNSLRRGLYNIDQFVQTVLSSDTTAQMEWISNARDINQCVVGNPTLNMGGLSSYEFKYVSNRDGWGVLHILASLSKNSSYEVIQEAITRADPNLESFSGLTPLMVAVLHYTNNNNTHPANRQGEDPPLPLLVIRELVQAGADLNRQDLKGNTALMMAIQEGLPVEVVRELVEASHDLNVQNYVGWTALMFACHRTDRSSTDRSSIEIVELLVKNGCTLNDVDDNYQSALTLAVKNGSLEKVKHLVWSGCDPDFPDKNGQTVLMLAVTRSQEISKELVQTGSSIFTQDYAGNSPLTLVARHNLEWLSTLVEEAMFWSNQSSDKITDDMHHRE